MYKGESEHDDVERKTMSCFMALTSPQAKNLPINNKSHCDVWIIAIKNFREQQHLKLLIGTMHMLKLSNIGSLIAKNVEIGCSKKARQSRSRN